MKLIEGLRNLWVLVLCAITLFACFVAGTVFARSEIYRLDENCEVDGFLGSAEHVVLQSRFWRAQEGMIDRQIATLQNAATERAAMRNQVADAKRDSTVMADTTIKSFCAEPANANSPACAPASPAHASAEALRERADLIDAASREAQQQQRDAAQVGALQVCKARVHQRAQDSIW